MRHYAKANRLDRLITLTYETEPSSRGSVISDLRRFFERFQERYGRRPLVGAIEIGEENGRLHVHLGVNFFIPKQVLQRLWGHGFVDVRRFRGGAGRARAGEVARYLAKYVGKETPIEVVPAAKARAERGHRYLVTQGFTPKTYRMRFYRVGQAYERLVGLFGRPSEERPFGDWAEDFIFGVWYAFAVGMWWPAPGP